MLGIRFPELKGVQRAEIWGIIIIACFNLALLAVAIRYGNLDQSWILLLVLIGQVCAALVIYLLLQIRHARDYMDDLKELIEKQQSMVKEQRSEIESLLKSLKDLPCSKNFSQEHKL